MKGYGETIRTIRQEKGFLQKEIYDGVVAKSFAIRFEKGEVMLQYDTFLTVLNSLNMTVDEFHFIHQNYQLVVEKNFWTEFTEGVSSSNERKLLNVYDQEVNSKRVFNRVVAYLARGLATYYQVTTENLAQALNKEEISYVENYFLRKKLWTLDDVTCINLMYPILKPAIRKELFKKAHQELLNYRDFPNYYERMTSFLSDYILLCYEEADYQEGNLWFVKLQSLPRRKESIYFGLKITLCEAYYVYTKKDFVRSEELINNYVTVLSSIGYHAEGEQDMKQFRNFKRKFDSYHMRIIR